ncbi:MAG: universal stress protein [Firmicutes bacterium]|nr:universal stress protein [Bacillota bacterium]
MGRRGLNRLQDILLGSLCERVVDKSKCPVTVVLRLIVDIKPACITLI